MEIKITQEEAVSKGRFFVESEGENLAEMTYSIAGPKKFIIDHTQVDERLRGQKVGLKLLEAAVAYAREEGKTIIPLCPFAKAQFTKHTELQDVLAL